MKNPQMYALISLQITNATGNKNLFYGIQIEITRLVSVI